MGREKFSKNKYFYNSRPQKHLPYYKIPFFPDFFWKLFP